MILSRDDIEKTVHKCEQILHESVKKQATFLRIVRYITAKGEIFYGGHIFVGTIY